MNTEIKKLADSGDIKSLKYIFVDALDVDPTFAQYKEEYNYCKSIPGLLEPHVDLTPFRANKAGWNEEYWTSLKMDLIKNFSDERMSHMRDVAQVFLAAKVQRALKERERTASNDVQPKTDPIRYKNSFSKSNMASKQPSISKSEIQDQKLKENRRKLENDEKNFQEKQRREQLDRAERQRQMQSRTQSQERNECPKKAIGIAVAAVAVAVILILLLK